MATRRGKRGRRRSKNLNHLTIVRNELASLDKILEPASETEKFSFLRLDAASPAFPLLWLQFAARARKLWSQAAPYMPAAEILTHWHVRVTEAPDTLPVWLFMDGDRVIGHCVCEAEIYYGAPFITVHQLAVDDSRATRLYKKEGIAQLLAWVEKLNKVLAESTPDGAQPRRFEALRFLTPRTVRAWRAWLPFDLELEERMLTFVLPTKEGD